MAPKGHEFGRFFRNRRKMLGLNLSEFCRLNGFDKGNISRLERGLVKPPDSPDLLQAYADALELTPNSEDSKAFMRHAAIARGKLPPSVSERAADVEAVFRRLDRRLHDPWVKAVDLDRWSPTRDAQGTLPTLVARLIHATTEHLTRIELPAGEGVQRHDWDGIVNSRDETLFVPEGLSGWEISVHQDPKRKANDDFRARTKGPLGLPPAEVTFVFVTSRKWDGKQEWRDEKRAIGKWKSVEVYDSSDLEAWLELAPGVDAWIAERLGFRPAGVISITDYWESLSRLCEPRLTAELFLTAREETAKELKTFLLGTAGVLPITSRSPSEVLDFVAAYLETRRPADADFALDESDRIRIQNRTVVVRDRTQWDGLSQARGPLILLPSPSLSLAPEELTAAVARGHQILISATQFSNHRLEPLKLSRPSRYALEEVLRKSGFDKQRAEKASRAAGGSLSVLKRHVSTTPSRQLPKWCSETDLAEFLPMLLAGAWDDANEVDRSMLSRLSGRPYAEVQKAAQRLALVEDAPLHRIESRWRLVSPEDAWSLAGDHLTEDLLGLFETTAIEILGQQDESIAQSEDERLRASILGTRVPRASGQLRRGICETTAVLGSGFGPAGDLPGARDRATVIVRTILQNADWLRWATLDRELPLLAEAAPDEFLAAIVADLKKKRPELARLLADDEVGNPLMSRCNHAGLLWALEGLAWSPELLSKVCMVLGKLDEVDTGCKSGNRPAGSLCEILLPWYPQTAANVQERIAVLKCLARRSPTVAWKVLFSMLPDTHSHSTPTRRPVWRNWLFEWQEGASSADYWKQVNAAAELIVGLAGSDPPRWLKILDQIQSIPDPHRKQLIERLQGFPVDEISTDDRRRLAEHLRRTIQHHRDFAGADWSLPADSVGELEEALPRLRPDDVCQKHAWLFVPWIDLEGFRDDYEGMEAEIARLRSNALREVIDQEAFDGVLRLAGIVESPERIGETLAQLDEVPVSKVLPHYLRASDASCRAIAEFYSKVRLQRGGWDWVRSVPLSGWNAKDAAAFLVHAPFDLETWSFAESLGPDVFGQYWMTVPWHSAFHLTQEQLEFACQELLKAGRPEHAINILSSPTLRKVNVSPALIMDVLAAFLKWRKSNTELEVSAHTIRTIQELFGCLQEAIPFNNDDPTRRLAQLERAYLSLLDGFGAKPQTLIRWLSDDSKFFADLIAHLFPSNDERQSEQQPSEEQRQWASHAYRLLMNWDLIPGTRPDGTIDAEQLLQWFETARSLCRESGHLEVADSQIGEMLARFPQPEDDDTLWPCEEICDAIEEANSDELDDGFQIGILNSRGVTSRSLFDGGNLERKEVAKYRRWAELCRTEWPRTAESLRKVAESYERDAQREDAKAAERAHERY